MAERDSATAVVVDSAAPSSSAEAQGWSVRDLQEGAQAWTGSNMQVSDACVQCIAVHEL